jgi:hypothetical protein
MPFIGNKPSAVPLTSADIADSIITSAKIVDGTIVNADINASAAIASTKLSGVGINFGTEVASTSGTSIDFTGIPSSVKQITVIFKGVSTSGTSAHIIRLGTSSGFVSTGYLSGGVYTGTGTGSGNRTDGLLLDGNGTASTVLLHGHSVLTNISGNSWVQSFVMGQSDSAYSVFGGGSITLSSALTQLRFTMANGTDTFDAGSINIMYE